MRSHHISAVVEPYCLINSLFGDPSTTSRVTPSGASDNNNTNDGYLYNPRVGGGGMNPRVIRIPGGLCLPWVLSTAAVGHPVLVPYLLYWKKARHVHSSYCRPHLNLQTNTEGGRPLLHWRALSMCLPCCYCRRRMFKRPKWLEWPLNS